MAYGGLQEVRESNLFVSKKKKKVKDWISENLPLRIFYSDITLQFLREQKSEFTANLVRSRVLPLYSVSVCLPYLVASANWILGELASCLPEVRPLYFHTFLIHYIHTESFLFLNSEVSF